MPLGQGITQMWQAIQDRIEVSGQEGTWTITAGSFDSALTYARERFGDPTVLSRTDRDRWWPRVALTVTTDPALAASAPPLDRLAAPPVPSQPTSRPEPRSVSRPMAQPDQARPAAESPGRDVPGTSADRGLPPSLEAIFAHQEEQRLRRAGTADGAWTVRR